MSTAFIIARGLPTLERLAERPHGPRMRYLVSAPCWSCGRALDDYGTCKCWTLPAPAAPEVQNVALLDGVLVPLKCTACGREYVFTPGVTSIDHCYFCYRWGGAS